MAEKRGLDFSDMSKKKKSSKSTATSDEEQPVKKKPVSSSGKKKPASEPPPAKARATDLFDEMGADEDDEDEEILADLDKGSGKTPLIIAVVGVLVVLVVIVAFLLFSKGKKQDNSDDFYTPPQEEEPVEQQPAVEPDYGPTGVGTQDFTQNTTMTNSNTLENPDLFVQDIHGLTTRVDYTVKSINSVADFVQYTKKRGTWGGGLELYWLDATYQESHYVIQIPFQYYKELNETGIIPVKMEVLTIEGAAQGQNLTVVSYMSLDENTLKDILKQQAKVSR